jgi:hypothetical protein
VIVSALQTTIKEVAEVAGVLWEIGLQADESKERLGVAKSKIGLRQATRLQEWLAFSARLIYVVREWARENRLSQLV